MALGHGLANLESLWLYGNQLSGAIPLQLGRLANLYELYISHNALSGCIPVALRNVPENDLSSLRLEFCH